MDLLLRLLQPRVAGTLAALILGIWAVVQWGDAARRRLELARHPPSAAAPAALSRDLVDDVAARDSAKLKGLHRAVSADIAAAARRRPGFDAARYQRIADAALLLDRPGYRVLAVERLNQLRMALPQGRESVKPAPADEDEDAVAAPAPRAKGKAKRRAAGAR